MAASRATSSQAAQRKNEHLALAQKFFRADQPNDFDGVHLVRPTLPETVVSSDSIRTDFFGVSVSAPFFINAMTGGSSAAAHINRSLGQVAGEQGIALALGSANIVGREPEALASFAVAREEDPDGPLVVNVNPSTPLSTIDLLVEELAPVALQVHVNAVQELAMPEGDRDFRWLSKIEAIAAHVAVPVIVKEVGFGFDVASLRRLAGIGVSAVDVAGSGGTDFLQIENSRRPEHDFAYLSGVGLSTVKSLLNARAAGMGVGAADMGATDADTSRNEVSQQGSGTVVPHTPFTVIASGGVRNPLDVVKSLVLGATSVGASNLFLHTLRTGGENGLSNLISAWKEQLAGLVALFGAASLMDLRDVRRYFDSDIVSYMEQSGIRA